MGAVSAGIADAYPRRQYPAVVIGSSGGALVHLCAALGVPWLPQTLLLPVRQRGISPDEPRRAAHALAGTGRALLDRNPDLVLHHMHDPNQDRLTLRRMAYFRVKRRTLGDAYERFLRERLEPGGLIVVAERGKRWPGCTARPCPTCSTSSTTPSPPTTTRTTSPCSPSEPRHPDRV